MKQKPWPLRNSDTSRFKLRSSIKKQNNSHASAQTSKPQFSNFNHPPDFPTSSSSSSTSSLDFSAVPYDALIRISATFTLSDLRAASLVCRAWRDALKPLCDAMVMFKWGKRFKHGRGGVKPNLSKALDSFLKAAARGSVLAMVDAGLIYWEMGKREEAIVWYRRAAELGDPAGQCNLAISFLQGEGLRKSLGLAGKWMRKAADHGHVKAQYEHGLALLSEGETMNAVVYLELATRAGEIAAALVRNSLLEQLSEPSRKRVMLLADKWRASPSSH